MINVRWAVLGGGPSGLSFACRLLERGETSFVVFEKEADAGGLCRSASVDGSPLDIGGGHFLDITRPHVLEFLFRYFARDGWAEHERIARVRLRGCEVDHPLEANLWQLPHDAQLDFLESIAAAGCVRGEPEPESFPEWIVWKLGEAIAREYMLPYNRKLFGDDLERLGTYWLYKLPNVTFRETLRSCLERRSFGSLPAHGRFLYPKEHGYGELWRRMGDALGSRLLVGEPVRRVDPESRVVNGVVRAERIVTTIPWTCWPGLAPLPPEVAAAASSLVFASVDVDYVAADWESSAHWIYEPDEERSYHRILARQNFSPGARGYWTETNAIRSGPPNGFRHRNEFAYPVNTRGKREALAVVLGWARARSVLPLGRWGLWEHMNSDVAVAAALAAADVEVEARA